MQLEVLLLLNIDSVLVGSLSINTITGSLGISIVVELGRKPRIKGSTAEEISAFVLLDQKLMTPKVNNFDRRLLVFHVCGFVELVR